MVTEHVLRFVRLPLLNARFLVGVVSADLLIKNDETCRELVDEAKNYLLLPEERLLKQGSRFKTRQPTKRGEVLFAVGGWCTGDAINSVERYQNRNKLAPLFFNFHFCILTMKLNNCNRPREKGDCDRDQITALFLALS